MSTTIRFGALVLAIVAAGCGEAPTPRKGEDPPMPLKSDADSTRHQAKVEAAKAELVEAEGEPLPEAKARLREARRIQYSDPAGAYDEAKASYQAEPHRDALWIMGFAACRLQDPERARYPLEHLPPEDRTKLVDYCAAKGTELTLPDEG